MVNVDGADVFVRDDTGISISVPTFLEPLFADPYLDNRSAAEYLLSAVAPEDLFLVNGFRTIVSPKIAREMGKRPRYHSAYSNFTFDLWMVLHRRDVVHCGDRKQYLRQINAVFGTDFQKMDEYKKEANFKAILASIGIKDVASSRRKCHPPESPMFGKWWT